MLAISLSRRYWLSDYVFHRALLCLFLIVFVIYGQKIDSRHFFNNPAN